MNELILILATAAYGQDDIQQPPPNCQTLTAPCPGTVDGAVGLPYGWTVNLANTGKNTIVLKCMAPGDRSVRPPGARPTARLAPGQTRSSWSCSGDTPEPVFVCTTEPQEPAEPAVLSFCAPRVAGAPPPDVSDGPAAPGDPYGEEE